MDEVGELPDQPHQNGIGLDPIQEFTQGEQTPDDVDEDVSVR
jgi:hypothetical protein